MSHIWPGLCTSFMGNISSCRRLWGRPSFSLKNAKCELLKLKKPFSSLWYFQKLTKTKVTTENWFSVHQLCFYHDFNLRRTNFFWPNLTNFAHFYKYVFRGTSWSHSTFLFLFVCFLFICFFNFVLVYLVYLFLACVQLLSHFLIFFT